MNEVKFQIVEGINTIYKEWQPNLDLSIDYSVIDIQMVSGPILADELFISDLSKATDEEGNLKFTTLEEILDEKDILRIRSFVRRVLEKLTPMSNEIVCFTPGVPREEDDEENEYYQIQAFCADMRFNGILDIYPLLPEEIESCLDFFCSGDLIRVVVIPEGRFVDLLDNLSLADPIPSTQRFNGLKPIPGSPSTKSLQNILKVGSLFLEEIDNGTRLRIVCSAEEKANITTALKDLIQEEKGEETWDKAY